MKYIFGLGSNLGDKPLFLSKATTFLSTLGKVISSSPVYETTPVGMAPGTENFYNSVVVIDSVIEPPDMIKLIKEFEKKSGRSFRDSHMKPRVIDIDILFVNRTILKTPELTIPHPEVENRKFVLAPLSEILPDHIHPVSGLTAKELLNKLVSNEKVKQIKKPK